MLYVASLKKHKKQSMIFHIEMWSLGMPLYRDMPASFLMNYCSLWRYGIQNCHVIVHTVQEKNEDVIQFYGMLKACGNKGDRVCDG